MPDPSTSILSLSYGTATLAHLALAILLVLNFKKNLPSILLLLAVVATACWSGLHAFGFTRDELTTLTVFVSEIGVDTLWLLFLAAVFSGSVSDQRLRLFRWGGVGLSFGLLAFGVVQVWSTGSSLALGSTLVIGSILTSLYALVLVEQIYSNTREKQRDAIKFLSLGVASLFIYDLILYSGAAFLGEVSIGLWTSRGFVIAMSAPLLAIAARRSEAWSMQVFVSRQVVFHTATLVGAGAYLTLIGLAGSFLQRTYEDWGETAQVVLFSAALIGLALFFLSGSSLSSIRVFISKHFFANRYDYREEWLRLMNTLTDTDEKLPLQKRSIRAILDILNGQSGRLWVREQDARDFHNVSSWDMATDGRVIKADAPLMQFLESSGWVVDFEEYLRKPERYGGIELQSGFQVFEGERFLVPLVNDDELIGAISVAVDKRHPKLNFEDTDLLKTAGRQIAAYLAQEQALERLAETRQFEAYNKLAAYLMHDLKNVSAQLSLVVKNADKHRRNPEFVDDAIDTVRGSYARLKSVIDHLHQGRVVPRLDTVELAKLVLQSVSQCADRQPVPKAEIPESRVYVNADAERLQMALFHAIRNAQDASSADDSVTVRLAETEGLVSLTVEDTGEGMSADYVEKHFFKPFSSTKGVKGMGIGAYQILETVRSLGGEVSVESEPSVGTRLVMRLRSREQPAAELADEVEV